MDGGQRLGQQFRGPFDLRGQRIVIPLRPVTHPFQDPTHLRNRRVIVVYVAAVRHAAAPSPAVRLTASSRLEPHRSALLMAPIRRAMRP